MEKDLMYKHKAQVLNEFVIIAAVVVVFCIAAIMTFGDSISSMVADNPFKNMYGSAKEEKVVAKQAGTDAASIRQNLKSGFVSTSGGEALLLSEVEIASLKVDAEGKIVDVKASVALSAPQKKSVTNVIYVYIDTLDHASYVIRVKKKLSKATQYSLLKNINIAAKNVDIAYNQAYTVAARKVGTQYYVRSTTGSDMAYNPYDKLTITSQRMEVLDSSVLPVEYAAKNYKQRIKAEVENSMRNAYWSSANSTIPLYVPDVDKTGVLKQTLNYFEPGIDTTTIAVEKVERDRVCLADDKCSTSNKKNFYVSYDLDNDSKITLSIEDSGLNYISASIVYKKYDAKGTPLVDKQLDSSVTFGPKNFGSFPLFDDIKLDEAFFDYGVLGTNNVWFLQ